MARPSLDEIYGKKARPSLDEIYGVAKPAFNYGEMPLAGSAPQIPESGIGMQILGGIAKPFERVALTAGNQLNKLVGVEPKTNTTDMFTGENVSGLGYDAQGNRLSYGDTVLQTAGTAAEIYGMLATGGAGGLGKVGLKEGATGARSLLGQMGRGAIAGTPTAALAGAGAYVGENPTESAGDLVMGSGKNALMYAGGNALLGAASPVIAKGFNAATGRKTLSEMVDEVNILSSEGKTAEANAVKNTPEYKTMLKENGLDDANLDKAVENRRASLLDYENTGIEKARGTSQIKKNIKQEQTKSAQRDAFTELAVPPTDPAVPFGASYANTKSVQDEVANSYKKLFSELDSTKTDILPFDRNKIINEIKTELYQTGTRGDELNRAMKKLTDDVDARLAQLPRGKSFDVGDMYNMKINANEGWGKETFGGKLDTAVGNILRRNLDKAITKEGLDATSKSIINHLRQLDATYAKTKMAEEYMKFLGSIPGGNTSKLLNMLSGFALSGGNPVQGIAFSMLSEGIQKRMLKMKTNALYDKMLGKVKSIPRNELLGETERVVSMIKDKGVERAGERRIAKTLANISKDYTKANKQYTADKLSAVSKLTDTLERNKRPLLGTGEKQAISNTPIKVSPTQEADIAKGFTDGTPLKTGLMAGTPIAMVLKPEDDPTSQEFVPVAKKLTNWLGSIGKEKYTAEKPPEALVKEIAKVTEQPKETVVTKLAKLGKAEVSKLKPVVDKASTTEYTIPGRVAKPKEKDLEELAAIIYGEISNRPLDKQILEAKTIANIVLNRMENHEWKGKSVADIVLEHKKNAKYPAFQAKDGKQYRDYKEGKPTDASKLKAINVIIDDIRNGKLDNNIDDYLMYAHMPDNSIRAFKDWNDMLKSINKIKQL